MFRKAAQTPAPIAEMSGSTANALWKTPFVLSASMSKPSATALEMNARELTFGMTEETHD